MKLLTQFKTNAVTKTAAALTLVAAASLPSVASAEYLGPDHVTGKNLQQILDNPKDDQPVQLSGYLVRKIGEETYVFSDGKQEINAEIESEDFPAQPFDENTPVLIVGEIDYDRLRGIEVDVDRLTIQ
ncbi:YgiW/YdeI family stress tolerance OB fold protein [Oceanobacter kriegii]|uniref:YgiW/YdeI family stress tolerance OB fold protein n=1 Tax=Oceanobacter kriegii TaxID=64972 RepID=UPI000418D115|nr:NirD/YgiW/YdeI family stress tolerance protein [Oceanobacter kriegii]